MSEFMFRVSLEFKVTPTETKEDEIQSTRNSYKAYCDNMSPKLNAQIVGLLESVGLLASRGDCAHQIFPKEQPSNIWIVGNGNQTLDRRKNVGKYGVCVRTPPLAFEEKSFEIIHKVCRLLGDKYVVGYPVEECYLRVHISKGVHGNFGCKLRKYLFAFLWAMEFQLDKFHPVGVTQSQQNEAASEYRQSFHGPWNDLVYEMRIRAEDNNPMTTSDAMDRILSCKTGNEVIELMNHPDIWGDQKYESLSLETPLWWGVPREADRFDRGTPGLLIQLHEGTLDGERIENWVRVCMGIIHFLNGFDDSFTYFEDFIRSVPDGKNYSPEDLLVDIALPELIEFYKPQFDEHDALVDKSNEQTE